MLDELIIDVHPYVPKDDVAQKNSNHDISSVIPVLSSCNEIKFNISYDGCMSVKSQQEHLSYFHLSYFQNSDWLLPPVWALAHCAAIDDKALDTLVRNWYMTSSAVQIDEAAKLVRIYHQLMPGYESCLMSCSGSSGKSADETCSESSMESGTALPVLPVDIARRGMVLQLPLKDWPVWPVKNSPDSPDNSPWPKRNADVETLPYFIENYTRAARALFLMTDKQMDNLLRRIPAQLYKEFELNILKEPINSVSIGGSYVGGTSFGITCSNYCDMARGIKYLC